MKKHELIKKIKKYYEYALTKIKVHALQKEYLYKDTVYKYILKENADSDVLVIVFSACTRQGIPARYNYLKTLESVKCNKLFILDDFGPDKRGSYYLGHMPSFDEETAAKQLIDTILMTHNFSKLIFCGSCKGGYAALNIGSSYRGCEIVIGEPTYRIASEYLLAPKLLEYWMGTVSNEGISYMDNYLRSKLYDNGNINNQHIYFMYSKSDEYYERHTVPLLVDLRENSYNVDTMELNFDKHADLGLYFQDYLKDKVNSIISE